MAYITASGQLQASRPWSINRLVDLFWGTIAFVTFFWRSLFNLDDGPRGAVNRRSGNSRSGSDRVGRIPRSSGVASPPACFGGG